MIDAEVQLVVRHLESAWNRGDATAFAQDFLPDGTFTNINGTTFEGHAAFEQRHREIFAGPAKGSSTVMTVRRSQRIRPDVAVVDVECNTTRPSFPSVD